MAWRERRARRWGGVGDGVLEAFEASGEGPVVGVSGDEEGVSAAEDGLVEVAEDEVVVVGVVAASGEGLAGEEESHAPVEQEPEGLAERQVVGGELGDGGPWEGVVPEERHVASAELLEHERRGDAGWRVGAG